MRHALARLLALVATPALLSAHEGHGPIDLGHGFFHPFVGWDHLLAMVAVGLLAAQCGGRARWLLPVAFVGGLTGGALVGLAAPGVFTGIDHLVAGTLVLLGLAVASRWSQSLPMLVPMVAICAAGHGLAHGIEVPAAASSSLYLVGMVLASALLHGAGLLVALNTRQQAWLVRSAGGGVAVAGLALLVGMAHG